MGDYNKMSEVDTELEAAFDTIEAQEEELRKQDKRIDELEGRVSTLHRKANDLHTRLWRVTEAKAIVQLEEERQAQGEEEI